MSMPATLGPPYDSLRFDGSTVRRFDGSTVRRFGGSAVRRFGGSAWARLAPRVLQVITEP
jgi:hypothetical protein